MQGFRGSLRVVNEWATRRLMSFDRDRLSKSETVTVAAIEGGVPLLVEAREMIADFQAMIRKKSSPDLEPWLERARSSLVASFASGIMKDLESVRAAITSPWSNGQTEGQITKLKLVKRQMYGRGKLDLLQARVIGAS
jgi:transposase